MPKGAFDADWDQDSARRGAWAAAVTHRPIAAGWPWRLPVRPLTEKKKTRRYHPGHHNDRKQPDAHSSAEKCEHEHHARAPHLPLIWESINFNEQECEQRRP